MMINKLNYIYLSIILSGFLLSCTTRSQENTNGKPSIVTTTGMLGDAVANIVGDSANVEALMGPGVDPHLYKATQGDLTKLTEADIIVYNGLHLEGKMGEVFGRLAKIKPVIVGGDGVDESKRKKSVQYADAYDPHIWFDVSIWMEVTKHLNHELQALHPNNKQYYEDNTTRFIAQLDSLHKAVIISIANIPEGQRTLITAHDAFEYFGRAYSIEVRGLQGISTVSEFGLKDITGLVDFIVERQIKAVFVETSVSKKAINAVVEGCKDRGFNVVIGGSLYSDAMGATGTPEGTYIGMVNANVSTIVNALK